MSDDHPAEADQQDLSLIQIAVPLSDAYREKSLVMPTHLLLFVDAVS